MKRACKISNKIVTLNLQKEKVNHFQEMNKPLMTICNSGITAKCESIEITICINEDNKFIKLSNYLNWEEMVKIILPDLQKTTKSGNLNCGPKLQLRKHLGIYVLQSMLDITDREIAFQVENNAIYQVFCGSSIVENWYCPHYTKIEEFRNRISPESHHKISQLILQQAAKAGFANPKITDFDSTVQEANIAYPSDVSLMVKLAEKAAKVTEILSETGKNFIVNLSKIKSLAKGYFFQAKNTAKEIKKEAFSIIHETVVEEILPVIEEAYKISEEQLLKKSKKVQNLFYDVCEVGLQYLSDVEHFIKTNTIAAGKILSFHAKAVACIIKNKAGKPWQFGRVYQLGRIAGNFMMIGKANDIINSDKNSLKQLIQEHKEIFGENILESVATDKGYYSAENIAALQNEKVEEIGIQFPENAKKNILVQDENLKKKLYNRRAGTEPLIGHIKNDLGLGRSRMKSDVTTESSAYRCTNGFNLRQTMHYLSAQNAALI